jgi:hypothetical protein
MARRGKGERPEPLPPPLPPERRTVGQLVGEAIRAYGARFWGSLVLGVPVVLANALVWARPSGDLRLTLLPITALLISVSYVLALGFVTGAKVRSRNGIVAYSLAVVLFLPVPLLVAIFILPGLIWLSLLGLAVPAVLVEGLGVRAALRRGLRLARADFAHVLGGLATLALVVIISQFSLYFVLREYADNTRMIAAALAALVVSPVVFLGSALLYVDQEARLRSRGERRKESDADVPDADHADREGRADAARQSRAPRRGEPGRRGDGREGAPPVGGAR